MESLKTKLRQLKLAGMVKSIETRNRYAIDNNVSHIDFIELLIEDEYANRKANSFGKRLNKSKINTQKVSIPLQSVQQIPVIVYNEIRSKMYNGFRSIMYNFIVLFS
jgi:hypothetical protein